jgi:acetyl-CoA acyltransferase 1
MRRRRPPSFLPYFNLFSKTSIFLQDIEIEIVGEEYKNMAATQRLSSVLAHLSPSSSEAGGRAKLLQKNPDDIVRPFPSFYLISPQKSNDSQVITYAARTPLTKAKKGALKDTPIDDLLIALLTVRPPISSLYPN